jgi:uncharacterized protein (TIGR00299 family) protein
MPRAIYFDCFAGASGDMLLGVLLDLGLPLGDLQDGLAALGLTGFTLRAERVRRGPIAATRALVEAAEGPPDRNLATITALLRASALPPFVVARATSVFERLARAEAHVHGRPIEEIHFHEVGALDAIVDITGAVLGLHLLGIEAVYCSPLPAGAGTVRSSHGPLPVPAPATVQLIAERGAPLDPTPTGVRHEMVTPTGAAILTELAEFRQPPMRLSAVGYGAGGRDLPDFPNVLRAWLGDTDAGYPARALTLLETNLDDMNPEILPHVLERLLTSGARDTWLTPIQMKKGRPAVLLSVLSDPEREATLIDLLLTETTTLGVRSRTVARHEAPRASLPVDTPLGPANVKVRRDPTGRVTGLSPEHDDCRRLAAATGRPLTEVYRLVADAGWASLQPGDKATGRQGEE